MPRTVVCCSLVLLLSGAAVAFAGTSTAANPVVTFSSPGEKQVQLQVCNSGGCHTVIKTVTVLDPMPEVTSLNVSPGTVTQTSVVHFSGTGIGAPPLTFTWRILNILGTQVGTVTGAEADWVANVPPGIYAVYLDLSNGHGTDTPAPGGVIVLITPFIFSDGFEMGTAERWLATP